MSGRSHHHHRGLHHQQHPSAAAADAGGWVESISALSDEHPATALLLGSPTATSPSTLSTPRSNGRRSSEGAAAAAAAGVCEGRLSPEGSGGVGGGLNGRLSPLEEFDAALDHALDVMVTEVGLLVCV